MTSTGTIASSPSVVGTAVGQVKASTVFQGQLILGGSFTIAGCMIANGIVAWNGGSWSTLGSGMGGQYTTLCPRPYDIR